MKGILLIVLGVVLTLMSLMLLLVERWALVGIALGILAIVYGRKEWKSSREIRTARAASKQQAVVPDAPAPEPERTFSKMETTASQGPASTRKRSRSS